MECPYCKIEMEKGYISGPRGVYWVPNDKIKRWNLIGRLSSERIGAIELFKRSFMKSNDNMAYCCKECKKIIIEYDEENQII